MTTQFVLVRHATCAQMDEVLLGRRADSALDERGTQQASALAHRLAHRAIDPSIYASPRRRTLETAEAIAVATGADVRVRTELDEVDFGHWSQQTFESLQADPQWRAWNMHRAEASTPAGETIASVQERVLSLLHAIDATEPANAVVVVTHSEIIRSLLFYCLEVSPNRHDRLSIDPASATTIRLGRQVLRVETVNERLAS